MMKGIFVDMQMVFYTWLMLRVNLEGGIANEQACYYKEGLPILIRIQDALMWAKDYICIGNDIICLWPKLHS